MDKLRGFSTIREPRKEEELREETLFKITRSRSRCQNFPSLISQPNTIGCIGGVSVTSTLIFLEKLASWTSRDGKRICLPIVVCSHPALSKEIQFQREEAQVQLNSDQVIENLKHKREFLERSGARCLVMPCHVSHAWYSEVSENCSLPFLHVGECVAVELKKAKLKPLHAASDVRIGVLTTNDAILVASYYKEKLQSQGFEVVLLDRATKEHTLVPAMEALKRKDMEGARNLLRVAIHVLLVREVKAVILASDDLLGLLPPNEPLLNKCIDPLDVLAKSTIHWAESTQKVLSFLRLPFLLLLVSLILKLLISFWIHSNAVPIPVLSTTTLYIGKGFPTKD